MCTHLCICHTSLKRFKNYHSSSLAIVSWFNDSSNSYLLIYNTMKFSYRNAFWLCRKFCSGMLSTVLFMMAKVGNNCLLINQGWNIILHVERMKMLDILVWRVHRENKSLSHSMNNVIMFVVFKWSNICVHLNTCWKKT